jgi:hypothetical protein
MLKILKISIPKTVKIQKFALEIKGKYLRDGVVAIGLYNMALIAPE